MHTLMVMGTLYLIYAGRVAEVKNITTQAVAAMVMSTVIGNGIPEAILAAVVATPIARVLEGRERRLRVGEDNDQNSAKA